VAITAAVAAASMVEAAAATAVVGTGNPLTAEG